MRLLLIALFIIIPCMSFAQGFTIKVGRAEFPTDKVPDHVVFPDRVNKFYIKKDIAESTPTTYVVQIGEEEHSFKTDGTYQEVVFSHDIRGLVAYILNDRRTAQGKPFILKKAK